MLSEKIKQVRREHHLSQEKFAEKLDISRSTVCRWEKGTSNPKPRQMEILISKYGLPTEENTEEIEQDENDIAIAASEISLERGKSEAAIYSGAAFFQDESLFSNTFGLMDRYPPRKPVPKRSKRILPYTISVAAGLFVIVVIVLTARGYGYKNLFYLHINSKTLFWLLFLFILSLFILGLVLFFVIRKIRNKRKNVSDGTEMTQNNSI